MTECRDLPLNILIVAPRPVSEDAALSREHLEVLYDVLEEQRDHIEMTYLWPVTGDALRDALAVGGEPSYDVVILDAATTDLGPLVGVRMSDAVIPLDHVVGPAAEHGVALLVTRLTAADQALDCQDPLARSSDFKVPYMFSIGGDMPVEHYRALLGDFWSALLAGLTVPDALDQARRDLSEGGESTRIMCYAADNPAPLVRTAMGDEAPLPKIVRFPSPDMLPAWQRLDDLSVPGGLPGEPDHGFWGRARELAQIECLMRSEDTNAPLWLYGYEGMGKTALIAHAARWAVRTGGMERVVYISFADGGSLEMAMQALGRQLVGERFSLRDNDPVDEIRSLLAQTPTLVVWDNIEGVLSDSATALTPEAFGRLADFGQDLGGEIEGCRLVYLSDTAELPAEAARADATVVPVGPLSDDAAVEHIVQLTAHHRWGWTDLEPIERLVAALGGHPLALRLVVSLEDSGSPNDLLAEMADILPGLDSGAARLGNQALDLALELLRRALTEDARPGLWALGVFAGRFMEPMSDRVLESASTSWADLEPLLSRAGLVSRDSLPGFAVPLLRYHPALLRYVRRNLSMQQLGTLRMSYYANYAGLLGWIIQNQSKPQTPARSLVYRELPNLRRVVDLLLGAEQLTEAIDYVRGFERILDAVGFATERDSIADAVRAAASKAVPAEGPLGRPGVQLLLYQGEQLFSLGRMPEALALYQQLTQRMEQENGLSYGGSQATYDRGVALYQLGRCMIGAGRADLAMATFDQSMEMLSSLEATAPVKQQIMRLRQEMGQVHLLRGKTEPAVEAFRAALALATQLDDPSALGAIHAQLGGMAISRKELGAGRDHLRTALQYQEATGDTQGMATIWGQLGAAAWEEAQFDEARDCFGQALEAAQKAGHIMLQAQSWIQLAQLAAQTGDPADAQVKYAEAIRIYQEHNVRPAWVTAEMSLADLLLREGDLTNARVHAEAARAIVEDVGPEAHPWEVHALLERISEAEGDSAKAAVSRMRAQESFFASTQARRVLQGWRPMIEGVARACLGETLSADTVELVEELEAKEEWHHLADAIWQVLGGERGQELFSGLDYVDAAVVRELLRYIESPELLDNENDEGTGETPASPTGVTLPQLLGAVAAAISGNEQAQAMVYTVLDGMGQNDSPDTMRALAGALRRILEGERDPLLIESLPEELRIPLTALLSQLSMS